MASHHSQDIIQNLNTASRALFDLVPSYLSGHTGHLSNPQKHQFAPAPGPLHTLFPLCFKHSSSWSWPPFIAARPSNTPTPRITPWYCPSQQYSALFLQSIHRNLHLLICVFLECLQTINPPDNKSSMRLQRSFLLIRPLITILYPAPSSVLDTQ